MQATAAHDVAEQVKPCRLHHHDPRPDGPRSLHATLAAAGELARGHDFPRTDLCEIDCRPLPGEFCLYSGPGLDPFAADWIVFELRASWREVSAVA